MSQVIVVGAGNWGRNLVKNFHQLGALAGVAEANPELRAAVETTYPGIPTYQTYDDALEAEDGPIVLATPAPLHYAMALSALKAGRDVFVEKPMTLRAEESRHLAEFADAHDRILMVGHLLLYQPAITWMRDYLASGQAGRVLHVATQRAALGKVRTEENVWWSFAPHDVAIILELLGSPKISQVKATGQALLQPQIEDFVHVDLQFEGGQSAHLHCSWLWPEKQRGTVVIAERQMLVYDEIRQVLTVHDKSIGADLKNDDRGSQGIEVTAAEPLKIECQHFLDCVQNRQRPRSDGWNGVAVVEILERVQEVLRG
ncbi:oxidoreductase [Leptolyngbya sp. 'hensonii']|uniref:Gfo/Idh/MocA family protein n=1 Tax=Leptolyngbya sp. 'hensonii' TaxID=1922337 RepID=UPI00094FC8EE|nr:Gfo/Idh/MocA family oxidoreductase [Leptolyngbya sp. 'hensonii']OLP16488.1 oxidoreductase [Leptolyngbya sp. 'hensonii']